MPAEVTLDGELLVMRDGEVAPFNDLQQRLNRKTPNPKLLRDYPAAVRLYDILREGTEDLRGLSFAERRRRLEAWYARRAAAGVSTCRRWCRSPAGTSCANCATARASAASKG